MKAIYAGSFDPFTSGHKWVLNATAELFDEIIVGVGINPTKTYTYSYKERSEMIMDVIHELKPHIIRNKTFTVIDIRNEFLVNHAKKHHIPYIIRGIRSKEDFGYEQTMRNINLDICDEITPIYLIPPRELCEVSSSLIKTMIGFEGWKPNVKKYLPPSVYKFLIKKYKNWEWKHHKQ